MLVTWDQHGEVLFIENGSFFGSMLLCHRKYLNLGRLLLSSHSTMELFLCIWQPGFSTVGHIMDVVCIRFSRSELV